MLLCPPLISFGQDIKVFSSTDIVINQLLENTVSFIKYKNTPKTDFRFYLTAKESHINWDEKRLSKWQIFDTNTEKIEKK